MDEESGLGESPTDNLIKIVLHFDLRNTVVLADTATDLSVEESLNGYLANVAWGVVDPLTDGWTLSGETPSLRRPFPEAVSYYKYLEQRMVKQHSDRGEFRRVCGRFCDTDFGTSFRPILDQHLQYLNFAPPPSSSSEPAHQSALCVRGKYGHWRHYLLPSFVRLLSRLFGDDVVRRPGNNSNNDRRQAAFVVLFRTFGLDARRVLDAVQQLTLGGHPDCPNRLNLRIDHRLARIERRSDRLTCSDEKDNDDDDDGRDSDVNVNVDVNASIYGHWSSYGHGYVKAIVDDFRWWYEHNYASEAGKPFWIDSTSAGEDILHIIFDDNIRPGEPDSIVDVRLLDAFGVEHPTSDVRCRTSDVDDDNVLHPPNLVQVDLLEAIGNKDYYVETLRQRLRLLNVNIDL